MKTTFSNKEKASSPECAQKTGNRCLRIVFAAALAGLLAACASQPRYGSAADIAAGKGKNIHAYLQTAEHLTKEQKTSMMKRRPFIGMTMEEAGLAMERGKSGVSTGGKTSPIVYTGGWGVQYSLFFGNSVPRRVENFWSISDKEVKELIKPRDLHPDASYIPPAEELYLPPDMSLPPNISLPPGVSLPGI
ncbi:MAG: hypothetical protein GY862_13445 [Gammaproteobacteria bacterium]|nr:hypothetical protein [Gammaproteobacteria bacterium]